jgi:pseudomonalisin
MRNVRQRITFAAVVVVALALLVATPGFTGLRPIVDDNDTVVLAGNVHALARPEFDAGATSLTLPMEHMILALRLSPEKKAALDRLLAEQQDPASPSYHHWLTPEEFGERFGPSEEEIETVTDWLTSEGFVIDEVAKGRTWINFSGTVTDVERAFHTQIHDYIVDNKVFHANAWDPSIPRGLAPLVAGVVSLNSFPRQPMNTGIHRLAADEMANPDYTSGSNHYLSPGDFAIIYNVNALYSAGIDGTGQTIAIVGRTHPSATNWSTFRSTMNLPANAPQVVVNGTDPGDLGANEDGEADLDVEWSGAVAKAATVKFVVSKSTSTTDGVDLSAQYIVNNNLAPVMSTSFGQCESQMGSSENTFYNNMWSQAASQGITSFVSSGDSGASGCDGGSSSSGSGLAVSGLASTPYNVAVGGTQFNDTSNPSAYWSSSNSTGYVSALSYIPEIAWNESGNVSGGSGLWASSGGKSSIYSKPSWQVCTGVPADGKRDIPDISLTAAGHDGYIVETQGSLAAIGGTSASSPSFAGLMALVVQKTGSRQGNANTRIYQMANAQYASGGTVIFHDTTSGNNSVPGVTGYSCTTGYDLVTGVGSVDAAAFVNNFGGSATPDFTLSASPTSVSVVQGGSGTSTITTAVSGGFSNAISLSATGLPSGASATFSPTSIAAPGSGSSTLTLTAGAATPTGTYTVTVTGSGGGTTHTAAISFMVTATPVPGTITNGGFETGDFTAWTTSGTASVTTGAAHSGSYGAILGSTSPTNGDSSAVQTFTVPASGTSTLSFWYKNTCPDTVTYDWATATVKDNATSSTSTVLAKTCTTSGSWTQVSFDLSASAGHSVTLTLTSHDDNYSGDATYTYYDDAVVTNNAPTPDFSISASPTSVSAVQGGSGTSTITTTVSGGFNAAISLSATGLPSGATATFNPSSIAAPGSGTSTLTLTAGSSTPTGTYTVTITGTGNSMSHTATISFTVTAAANPDFTISAAPVSVSAVQGGSGTSTITTAVSGGFNYAISLSATGLPGGATATFNPTSIAAPGSGSSTLTLTAGASTATGTYTVTITGSGGTKTHTATISFTVTAAPPVGVLTNGDFETGNFTGWSTSGTASVTAGAAHSGSYGAMLGSTSPTNGDSSAVQTFTVPASGTSTLSFWYKNTCPDTVTYDWATATVKDNATSSTSTVLAKTCTTSGSWTQVSFDLSASAGHSVTLTLTSHDDNYSGDATYTYYDDAVVTTTSPTPDFTISASPGSVTVAPGGSGTSTITTAVSGGFNSAISLSASGLPSGATASFSPSSISAPGSGTSTLTLTAGASTAPGAYTVTITGTGGGATHTTAISFTVTGGGPTTLFSNGFESSSGWASAQVSGTAGSWTRKTSGSHPSASPHGGSYLADFNSYTARSGNQTRYYRTSGFAVSSGYSTVSLSFWMYHDTGYSSYADKVQVQVSTNGSTWTNVGSAINRYNGSTGWAQANVDLSAYKGASNLYIAFVGISAYGNDCYIDDVTVTGQ